jgi:NDP-sugar pyrophosphorylase family protein
VSDEGPAAELPPVLVLAGGLGTRLGPLARDLPKPLVPVAGEPFLAHPLALLARNGARRVVIAVGHRGHMVEETFGDGSALGLDLVYVHDGPALRGTAGAVRGALPVLAESFLVLYGDTYLRIDYRAFAATHAANDLPGTMSVLHHPGRLAPPNCVVEGGLVTAYDKRARPPGAEWIDYGLLAFEARVFAGDGPDDLGDVTAELARRRELGAYAASERFYEIGTPEALAETDAFLRSQRTQAAPRSR